MAMQYIKLFEPVAVVLTTPTTVFTVPATVATIMLRGGIVRLTNTTAAPAAVTLYAVPLAGAAGVTNQFLSAKTVPANDYVDVMVPQMKAGDFVQAFATVAAAVNIQSLAGAYYSS